MGNQQACAPVESARDPFKPHNEMLPQQEKKEEGVGLGRVMWGAETSQAGVRKRIRTVPASAVRRHRFVWEIF